VPNLASPIESTSAASYQINEDSALNILETNSSIFESSKTQRSQVDRHRLYLECSHHISNNIERSWLNCVQDIETDGDGSITSQCILGVTQVLRVCEKNTSCTNRIYLGRKCEVIASTPRCAFSLSY
jgi:hypothetical protein